MFTIIRVEKLKSFANVRGANTHNRRLVEPANSNPKSKSNNIHWGARDPVERIKEIHRKHGIKPRKNAVIANEYLLSASPEFFHMKSDEEIKSWAKSNFEYLKKKHGESLVSFDLHLDESTPHIHAIVTPIYQSNSGGMKLSAKHYFDKPKLKKLQTDYAKSMSGYGLCRGIENSRSRHQDIRKFYGELEQELREASQEVQNTMQSVKAIREQPVGFLNYKTVLNNAFTILTQLAQRLAEIEKLNAALNHKFSKKVTSMKKQIATLQSDRSRLAELYEITGMKSPNQAHAIVKDAAIEASKLRARELAAQESAYRKHMEEFDGLTPAQRMGLKPITDSETDIKKSPKVRTSELSQDLSF
ncbi:MobV family relaxase [Neptuniibacter caesariensis]|uniref:Plasmid recombination enzyme n=1 Tax=Neptuniibacter caesariensis TaxID=207954 RepID=A0A7U8C7P0_NEPCE|nr:MobV family relaxase [Neptuniibacter caesariensis]EAR62804.1 hypothetical protein MED92_06791 [Oceanospirillum sp. MED92] [Neptuniibacter caesariensis]